MVVVKSRPNAGSSHRKLCRPESGSKRRGRGEIKKDNGGCKLPSTESSRKRTGRREIEHGCKRRRPQSSCKQRGGRGAIENNNGGHRPESIPTLMSVKEQVCRKRIRLFKWNESLLNEKYPDSETGIVLLYVNKIIKDRTQNPDGTIVEEETEKHYIKSSMFKLELFQNIREYIHPLAELSLAKSNAFEEAGTIAALADEISKYISINFRFTKRNLSRRPRKGRVVIFVEVDLLTTKYHVVNDDESIMPMDQEENSDQFDQQSYVYVQLEDDSISTDSGVEETGEEEDDDDDMESLSSEVVSSPDLIEIQVMLWRCLEDWTEFIRIDPDFSRDSKGLKQVEDAMETITEFQGNEKNISSCSCPCCLEELSEVGAVKTRCSHLFHRDCLSLWLSKKDSCPLCRSPCATLF